MPTMLQNIVLSPVLKCLFLGVGGGGKEGERGGGGKNFSHTQKCMLKYMKLKRITTFLNTKDNTKLLGGICLSGVVDVLIS